MQETIDREGLVESLVFMTGHDYKYFESMSDDRLLEEYDHRMNINV